MPTFLTPALGVGTTHTGGDTADIRTSATDVAYRTRLGSDSFDRLQILADGSIGLGAGTAAPVMSMYWNTGRPGIGFRPTADTGTAALVTVGTTSGGSLTFWRVNTSMTSPTAVAAADVLGGINFGGYIATVGAANTAAIGAYASDAYDATNRGSYVSIFVTPKATAATAEKVRFVDSSIQIGGSFTTSAANTVERLRINTPVTLDTAAAAQLGTGATGTKGLVIQGVSGQTGLLVDLQQFGGNSVLTVGNDGGMTQWGSLNSLGNITAQFTGAASTQIGAYGPSAEAAVVMNDASIFRSSSGVLDTRSPFRMYGMNSTSTTAYSVTSAARIANRNATTNNWAQLQFDSSAGTAVAGMAALNTDHTNAYGELWFHSRSAAGFLPRLRIPSTGGMDVYGDASGPVLRVLGTGAGLSPTLGTDLLTNGTFTGGLTGWTAGAGWSASANTALHTVGNVATLTQAMTGMSTASSYLVTVTVTGRTAGGVTIAMGSNSQFLNATGAWGLKAGSTTPTFTITPTTDFDGAIDAVAVQVAPGANGPVQLKDAAGTTQGELRSDVSSGNHAFGNNTATRLQSGSANNTTAVGNGALSSFVGGTNSGIGNTAYGSNTMSALVIGNYNVAVGYQAMMNSVNGAANVAVGQGSLYTNTSGSSNVAIGSAATFWLTTGNNNVAAGQSAGLFVTTGSNNTMLGIYAGVGNFGTSTNALTTGSGNVFLGINSRLAGTTQRSDAVAIGNAARIDGDSAVAIGTNASAGAAGAVAIGTDSSSGGATTTTANEFVFGTANHTYRFAGSALSVAGAISTTGLTGATAASRLVGATTSGAPASGTFVKGDVVIDQTGKVWINTTAGSPGTFTQVGGGSATTSYWADAKWGVD